MEIKQERLGFLRLLPLLWLSLAFLIGIVVASLFFATTWLWLLLAFVALACYFVFRPRLAWSHSFFLVAACILFFGAARYQSSVPNFTPADLAYYNDSGEDVIVHGFLLKPPVIHDSYTELRIAADEIAEQFGHPQPVSGMLIAQLGLGGDWHYGDEIQLRGTLESPVETDEFSYRDYLARQGVYSIVSFGAAEKLPGRRANPIWAALFSFRQNGIETIYRLYPDPEASLLAGILLGDESGISDAVKTAFNDTGTRHIIAISGFNISIIAGFMLALFSRWLGARRGIRLAILGIIFYTLIVGAEASVVRAAIMGTLALVARQVGRQQFALNTLAFSAATMAMVNPLILWDVGFQLSFSATLGLVLFADPIQNKVTGWLSKRVSKAWLARLKRPLSEYVFLTVAAQITTLPLLLYYFRRFTFLSLPANLLILPAQPALMILGGLSVLVGFVALPLGKLVSIFAWPFAAFTIRIVQAFAAIPGASQFVSSFPLALVIASYGLIAAITLRPILKEIRLPRLQPIIPLACLAAFTFWTWSNAFSAPNGRLELTLLDVPGEAILIRTPGGRSLLIDGGSSSSLLGEELGKHLPFFDRKLDWLLIVGQRPDQITALKKNLERVSFEGLGWAGNTESELWAEAQARGNPTLFNEGDTFDLGDGAEIHVLAAGERGATLLVEWGKFRAFLPLGLDFDQLEKFENGETIGPVDLLLLADSGYPPLNPPEWIANLDPTVVWLPGASGPETDLLAALGGWPLLLTAESGWLRISTDGSQMWFEAER